MWFRRTRPRPPSTPRAAGASASRRCRCCLSGGDLRAQCHILYYLCNLYGSCEMNREFATDHPFSHALFLRVQMVLGGVVYTAVPFYKRARQIEDKAIENVETALDVLERASEVTEKFAANVANSLPEDGSLHKLAEELEYIAEEVDKDAQKAEVMIKKIEALSDKIDAAVEPVIENLEEEFKPNPASHAGSDAQK
uniref:Uncharacterized protein n=1 Tax=Aegilops tauschii subsp. strangulata TaxID=200361 RepID=A0A453L0X7_AEGTS